MKVQLNARLNNATINQINWLAQRFSASQAQIITMAIHRLYLQERKVITINLIENNAGHLFIGMDAGPWYNVTGAVGTFDDDATAIANGDTDDWTVERYDDEPDGTLVATWLDGALQLVINNGQLAANIAAHRYMDLPSHWY